MTTRQDVFVAINDERDYQNQIWKDTDEKNSAADYLIYMERYLDKAKLSNDPIAPGETLLNILKVVSIGVAALEKLGIATRADFNTVITKD